MKTNKHQTLCLVAHKGVVRAHDLATAFAYSGATARSYLAYLARQGLLSRSESGYGLTEKGHERVQFFELGGCADPTCPRCQGKRQDVYTCSTCGWEVEKDTAVLRVAWETAFFKREAGVYCSLCQGQIFTEQEALILGIKEART